MGRSPAWHLANSASAALFRGPAAPDRNDLRDSTSRDRLPPPAAPRADVKVSDDWGEGPAPARADHHPEHAAPRLWPERHDCARRWRQAGSWETVILHSPDTLRARRSFGPGWRCPRE